MTSNGGARIIDGTSLARSTRDGVAEQIKAIQANFPRFQPSLAVIQAGERPDSSTYVRMKAKAATEAGIQFNHIKVSAESTTEEIVDLLPLGGHIGAQGERQVTEAISPEKDVDGFHAYNIGHLSSRAADPLFAPCTPAGCIRLLETTGINLSGLHAVDATVTQCHSRTKNIEDIVKTADIVVAAIGKPEFVKGSWIKPSAIVIDYASKKSGQRLVGDVEYAAAAEVASLPSPSLALLRRSVSCTTSLRAYGKYKAKVTLDILDRLEHRKNGKYIVVAGITPTPLGEGKSTTTIGLAQALGAVLGRPAFACVRQPSQGPTFGIKGGAAGGGYSQVIPMDEFNLHLTGDIHAQLYKRLVPAKKGKREFAPLMFRRLEKLGINKTNPNDLTPEEINRFARLDVDLDTITWNRVLDTNDRYLRKITIGEAATEKGLTRSTGFDIAVASEVMAILALTTDLQDMQKRLGAMVVATSKRGDPITADDIGVSGALAVLMKDAIKPNLMQTLEGTPVFVHAGPFANIAHGNSSIIADRVALKLAGTEEGDGPERVGYVLTEGGFGADMGMEKFCNIKCRTSGLKPDATVIVATTRALKMHGGGPDVSPGKPLHDTYTKEDLVILKEGCKNLVKHIQNSKKFGVKVIVAINPAELALVREEALAGGADAAVVSNHWAQGGAGAKELAEAVIDVCEGESQFKFLYDLDRSIEEKIETISKEIYGADGITLSEKAQAQVDTYTRQGYSGLPICMAKTQYSFSHDPKLKNVPTGFTIPIREVRLSAGAGFLYPILGDMQTMPGLGTRPGFWEVGLDPESGRVIGLF
ncbi:FTHFS-domain-containing protein [Coprinellus micaceus]|uniref:FTHFS-domain-containing protein n=1 Tax=Coprinellus micaceus TaxID=71717 RepID=A0A4Y7TAW1_COPMI|nr:FTHFS-domain-containing protein [Coprinellus micaceus]